MHEGTKKDFIITFPSGRVESYILITDIEPIATALTLTLLLQYQHSTLAVIKNTKMFPPFLYSLRAGVVFTTLNFLLHLRTGPIS
jgi:hypothetical protein